MSRQELRELAGACLFLGIDETEPCPSLQAFLDELLPGGIILFARNVLDAPQVQGLNAFLAGDPARPRLLGVDQEGGRVERLRPLLGPLPSGARLAAGGVDEVHHFGHLLGNSLRALGFNLNFAPVLDLSLPGAPNLIGDRAFGDQPETVASLGRAYLDGLARAGVHGVVKHFPGLGPTQEDTHQALARAAKSETAFRREDLLPFRETLAHATAVMVAHAHYPFWDPAPLPASCSTKIVHEILRGELGYGGLAVADDLEMGAVEGTGGAVGASTAALAAGCDMLLVCRSRARMTEVRDRLVAALEDGSLSLERVRQAATRVDDLRRAAAALPAPPEFPGTRTALAKRFACP
jgi:beta-N-acetylhexosaminidase